MSYSIQNKHRNEKNRPYTEDLPVHRWYRFVLSFPPHLVREYLELFGITENQRVLDPFCGTGTTLVEAKKLGISSVGIDANPVVHFAACVKTDWNADPDGLMSYAETIASEAQTIFDMQGIGGLGPLFQQSNMASTALKTFNSEQERLVIKNSISPLPLHKVLTILELLEAKKDERYDKHAKLGLAKQVIRKISNLRFGPEVGVGKIKSDAPVIKLWMEAIKEMASDLEIVRNLSTVPTHVYLGDARSISVPIALKSIDAVITSPPYPNEKDYSRITRLESVLLGFITDRKQLRRMKQQFVRSNTRSVYKADNDDTWISGFPRIQELADTIEQRRIELQKTSGFEKLYGRVVLLYFGGMVKHLESLKPFLRPGAKLAYVVGDQASYFRIMIRTGHILAEVAEALGYTVLDIDLFRTRFSTATRQQMREEVVQLQWKK